MSDYFTESKIPEGWERLSDGIVQSDDQVWISWKECFEVAAAHIIGCTVKSRYCAIRRVPPLPEGYELQTDQTSRICKGDLKRNHGEVS